MQNELTKEDIYADYVKVGEIQEKISTLNKELEENMISWEELQNQYSEI